MMSARPVEHIEILGYNNSYILAYLYYYKYANVIDLNELKKGNPRTLTFLQSRLATRRYSRAAYHMKRAASRDVILPAHWG